MLDLQRTRGNRAMQLFLQRSVSTPADEILSPATKGKSSPLSHPAPQNPLARPVANILPLKEHSVQRLSWSDLNPIDAAKRLAERAWSGIKDSGSAAWDTAKEVGRHAWETVEDGAAAVWDNVTETASSVWETVKSAGTAAWSTAKSLGSKAWNLAKESGSKAWNWAKGMGLKVWNGAKSLGSRAWDWAKSFGSSVWSSAKSLGGRLWSSAKSLGSRAWSAIQGGIGKAWSGIKKLGSKVWTTVKSAANKSWQFAKKWGGKAWSLGKSIVDSFSLDNLCKAVAWLTKKIYGLLAPLVRKAWDGVKKLGAKVWDFAKKWGGKLWNSVKGWVSKIGAAAKRALSQAYAKVKELAGKAWSTAKRLGGKLLNGAKQLGAKAWNFAKGVGAKAWNGAKSLAGKVWNLAKSWGGNAINAAKRLGAAAWEKAKALGTKIWDTAKGAASKLLGLADKLTGGMASKVAGLAKSILGKAAGLLSWVFDKARDLANRALETAKSWAGKALDTAKSWGKKLWDKAKSTASKAWDTAKSLAAKAWNTAKELAAKAWDAAKRLGQKAIDTAKNWASKAWTAAKTLAGRAWASAKSLASKAWSTLKRWTAPAWKTIKNVTGKVWGKVKSFGGRAWNFAKGLGSKAWKIAKDAGSSAWKWLKQTGSRALDLASKARQALMKRLQRAVSLVKSAGKYLLMALIAGSPVGLPIAAIDAAIKVVGCALGNGGNFSFAGLVDKALKFAPFLRSIADAVKDPNAAMMPLVAAVAGKLDREMPAKALDTGRQRLQQHGGAGKASAVMAAPSHSSTAAKTPTSTLAAGGKISAVAPGRTTTSLSEIWSGFVRHITAKWATVNVWQMVKDMFWTLLWPWPTIGRELSGLWSDVKTAVGSLFAIRNVLHDPLGALHDLWTNLLHLLDIPLAIWRRINNILMSLMGWVTIALVILGAVGGSLAGGVIGGILAALPTLGVAAPAGATGGAGAGGLAGAGAGWAAAMGIGEMLLVSFVSAEVTNIEKKLVDLVTGEQTTLEKEEDYSQIADSLIGLGVTGVLVLIGWIASRLAAVIKGAVARIRGPKGEVPEIKPGDTKASDVDPSTGKRIVAEEPIGDGHEVEITEDGECRVCSDNCKLIRDRFKDVLSNPDPALDNARAKLDAAEKMSGVPPEAKAKAEAEAAVDLTNLEKVLDWEKSGKIRGDLTRLKEDLASANQSTRQATQAELIEFEESIKAGKIVDYRGATKGPDLPDREIKARTEPFTDQKNAQNFFNDRIKAANDQFKGAGGQGKVIINLGEHATISSKPIDANVARDLVGDALSKGARGTNITEVVVKDGKGNIIYHGLGD